LLPKFNSKMKIWNAHPVYPNIVLQTV